MTSFICFLLTVCLTRVLCFITRDNVVGVKVAWTTKMADENDVVQLRESVK